MKVASVDEDEASNHPLDPPPDPDDAFNLVTQVRWEDDIIWNGEECKSKVFSKLKAKGHAAGWIPSSINRRASAFNPQVKDPKQKISFLARPSPATNKSSGDGDTNSTSDDTWYSIFPIENEELIHGVWEDDIIWDAENMKKIPEPKILTLDLNDENIVLGIPDDVDPTLLHENEPAPIPLKEKKQLNSRKSRILLGKSSTVAKQEIETPKPPTTVQKDPWNISNDEYYNPKTTTDTTFKPNLGINFRHSIPALELRQPFFPTHIGQLKLRSFHRPPLKKYSHGTIADTLPHSVLPLVKHIKKKAKQREAERQAAGGGEIFFMRTPEDLSGKDGDLILAEMSEEHPPLLSQVGMASRIKNYYKRRPGKDGGAPDYEFGETAYSQQSPFLGNLGPGQSLQTVENNLYRAPIYKHDLPDTDFLIIRTRNNYFIREVNTIFTVGQELPLFEVPGPNSKKANNFIRDFLQVFIYRLFYKSNDNPRRIKGEDIKKAFPSYPEHSIRRVLNLCAEFTRLGTGSFWVLKPDFRLPTEDEIRAMVSPEQCCAFYSMIAAEQRLKDAGYAKKSLNAAEGENDAIQMDDELKAAPWNTTRAFIAATNGKALLELDGVADPTGCGEGFSYVRIPNRPRLSKEESQKEQFKGKKTVAGTDADLRRLPLKQAKLLLRKHGVPEAEIKKLSRWEINDLLRTLSSESNSDQTMAKFARGARVGTAEYHRRYKEECQRIFDLQNRLLSSNEVLSSDEDDSERDDSDIEEMGKTIEQMLVDQKSLQDVIDENEERERLEFMQSMMDEDSNQSNPGKRRTREKVEKNVQNSSGKVLKIYRTFVDSDGKEYTRVETVRKPAVIDVYVTIKTTKNPEFIRKFATDLNTEEKLKEKKRLQQQLRALKRNEEKKKRNFDLNSSRKSKSSSIKCGENLDSDDDCSIQTCISAPSTSAATSTLTLRKCGACGALGHMKSNKNCPLYRNDSSDEAPEADDKLMDLENDGQPLIRVDETKIIFSKKLLQHAEEQRRKSLVVKVPKEVLKRKRRSEPEQFDYLKPIAKSRKRRKYDPEDFLENMLLDLCTAMQNVRGSEQFWTPVSTKYVPDYYQIVTNPIDLASIKNKVKQKKYTTRAQFLSDVNRIFENSVLYNGADAESTCAAKNMYDLCVKTFEENSQELTRVEKAINPLLDDDDQAAFSFLLDTITEKLKAIHDSTPFHHPVNMKRVPNYYQIITSPMDLATIKVFIKNNRYFSIERYMDDVNLILKNSSRFFGPENKVTLKAHEIVTEAKLQIEQNIETLRDLEKKIAARRVVSDSTDSESVVTTSSTPSDRDAESKSSFGGIGSSTASSSATTSHLTAETTNAEAKSTNEQSATQLVREPVEQREDLTESSTPVSSGSVVTGSPATLTSSQQLLDVGMDESELWF